MPNKIKLALLGCGDVAHRDYLPEFHRIADRAEIVAVCGRGRERAEFTAGKYNIPRVYTDYEKMLAETDAEAIINLTPVQLHYETNLACLQAGKHVYTEKTAASNNDQARQLERETAQRNLTFVCAPCEMVWPQIKLAEALLKQNAIGEVHSARGIGHGGVPPWAGFPSDPSPFFAKGGGPQRDMGVYPLHAITGLLGPARQVKALSVKAQAGFTVGDGPFAGKQVPMEEDDTWIILLHHGNGVISSVEANNSVQSSKAPQLELFGLKGTLALNVIDCAAPIDVLQTDKGWDWQSVPVPHERAGGPDHILGVQHLVECVQTGTSPVLSIAHAAHVIEILDAAAASSATGNAITISSSF